MCKTHESPVIHCTAQDPTVCELNKIIIQGRPSSKSKLPQSLHPYWTFRDELTFQNRNIYKGNQVVIPTARRAHTLKKAHVAHFGQESNQRLCKDVDFGGLLLRFPGKDYSSNFRSCTLFGPPLCERPQVFKQIFI